MDGRRVEVEEFDRGLSGSELFEVLLLLRRSRLAGGAYGVERIRGDGNDAVAVANDDVA
jgi:hypothetical protein